MRLRRFKTWQWALPFCAVLGGEKVREPAQADASSSAHASALLGEHEVRARVAAAGVKLELNTGFSVRVRATADAGSDAWLKVAKARASAAEIAPGFVPIGPAVELHVARRPVDVAFVADHFRVRAQHRLVLAVEAGAACGSNATATCWQLWDAAHEAGRCVARGVLASGLRMQFGSVPATTVQASGADGRTAAP